VEKYLPSKNKGTGFSPKQPSLIRTEAWSDQCKKKKKKKNTGDRYYSQACRHLCRSVSSYEAKMERECWQS
jgi:hypothetical protein